MKATVARRMGDYGGGCIQTVLGGSSGCQGPDAFDAERFWSGREGLITDWRKGLDALVAAAGELYVMVDGRRRKAEAGDVRSKAFRHGYAAARLHTLDAGRPVAVYTVSRGLGHGSTGMVEATYAHLGKVRHRSDVVEFRADAFAAILEERLRRCRPGLERPRLTLFATLFDYRSCQSRVSCCSRVVSSAG